VSKLVSIIVPVYNSEDFLPDCLASLCRQSYKHVEILLIDDGSTDSSPRLCDEAARKDPRVHALHKRNGGIASAQNAGLEAAHGDYITFCDNDDLLAVNAIDVLVTALERADADISKGRWQQFGLSQTDEIRHRSTVPVEPNQLTLVPHPLASYQNVFCKTLRLLGGGRAEASYFNEANWCKLYRRGLWDGIHFPEGSYAQDVAVTTALYSRAGMVADVDAVLYYWRQSGGSVTHKKQNFAYYADNVNTGLRNFADCLDLGVTPARSYYQILGSLASERRTADFHDARNQEAFARQSSRFRQLRRQLTPVQRAHCYLLTRLRQAENLVYDRTVLTMK
jgi:glycosyltransferase involved in cell wall biosynthesis